MDETVVGSKKNTGMAAIAYVIFFLPLLTDSKNDPFVKFHVKQGLVLLVAWVVNMVVGMIPILGWILFPLVGILLFVLFIIGILNALGGKEKELPLIGKLASNFNF